MLLSLTLLTAACQKESNEPEPVEAPLEGRWIPDSSFDYNYSASGAFVSRTSITVIPDYYLRITPDSIGYHAAIDNRSLGHYKLFRQNKNLTFGRISCTILELTNHKLILRFKATTPPGGAYTEQEDVYIR
ncbi:hypothetical protein GCM10011378_32630 [Hymenobacter glacieicola]|uniref:Lipocalin-like domain-containing protein n=1 Tax=Hymenobacter glacieicola TaxID=1562124 RepID=A0ABQ1X3U7_9BACT|nr:hypothetical protein GCM10011378_32630 [Hymenobacter glacieicola]